MTEDEFIAFTQSSPFQEAKTMKAIPHAYTLIRKAPDPNQFLEAARFIRREGFKRPFYGRVYTYYRVGDFVYWSMDDDVDKTILINRAHKDTVHGGVPD